VPVRKLSTKCPIGSPVGYCYVNSKNLMDRSALQENLVQQIIDGMDMDGLCQLAYDYLNDNYDKYSEKELTAEIEEYYPNILEESNTN